MKKLNQTVLPAVVLALAMLMVSLFTGGLTAAFASSSNYVRGMNLTETDGDFYDANLTGAKSAAQVAVDSMKGLGVNHVVLNPRATMVNPRGNEIVPRTPLAERSAEKLRYGRLIKYIQSQGMTVGIRPIFFVVDAKGSTPYVDNEGKAWWHGNIQPSNPNRWFESFKNYLDIYMQIAKLNRVEEFTIGAELYSMTVGIEDQWKEYQFGFPAQWLELLHYTRAKLPDTRIMYDINFTDDSNNSSGGLKTSGGEFERWRYRLVDLQAPRDPAKRQKWEQDPNQGKIWKELAQFWSELDAVGIDMYRSLASKEDTIPTDYSALVALLQGRAESYATQLDNGLSEIEAALGVHKELIFKEIGFRSVNKGFIDPFSYETGNGELSIPHQAAAYESIFNAVWVPNWTWFKGICFWDVGVSPHRRGPSDRGFSPLDKPQTENVIKKFYKNL